MMVVQGLYCDCDCDYVQVLQELPTCTLPNLEPDPAPISSEVYMDLDAQPDPAPISLRFTWMRTRGISPSDAYLHIAQPNPAPISPAIPSESCPRSQLFSLHYRYSVT